MACSTRSQVLLLSRLPEMRREFIRSFQLQGSEVFVARRASQALGLLRNRPEMVIVDLALGANLTPALVRALNRESSSTRVVVLHDGNLEIADELACHLYVQGFCRAGDVELGAWPQSRGTVPPSHAIH
jgi:ActR/RegA family two-component response regulator